MSIEAIDWALNRAPIPTDRKDASTLAITLIALANHAGPDGRDAFPSVERMVRYTRLSRRTIQRSLRSLEELGLDLCGQHASARRQDPGGQRTTPGLRPPVPRVVHSLEREASG